MRAAWLLGLVTMAGGVWANAIEHNHGATSEQVHLARGQRNWSLDVAVSLLFLPLYLLGAMAASRWLSRRFSSDERLVMICVY